MRDIFYTLVVLWLLYRIWQAFSAGSKSNRQSQHKQEGDITIHHNQKSNTTGNDKGEYVDYEEVKDDK